jgi:hypothetical protein
MTPLIHMDVTHRLMGEPSSAPRLGKRRRVQPAKTVPIRIYPARVRKNDREARKYCSVRFFFLHFIPLWGYNREAIPGGSSPLLAPISRPIASGGRENFYNRGSFYPCMPQILRLLG